MSKKCINCKYFNPQQCGYWNDEQLRRANQKANKPWQDSYSAKHHNPEINHNCQDYRPGESSVPYVITRTEGRARVTFK